jgi:hypothetical protein
MDPREAELLELKEMELKLVYSKWKQKLNEKWPIWPKSGKHRREITDISHIEVVKQKLVSKLHPVAIREFLKLFGIIGKDSCGAYRNSQKGMLLLFQLVTGKSDHEMFINQSTYSRISRSFWSKKNLENIYRWCVMWFSRFSNNIVRLLHARVYNPPKLKHVTLMIDGIDIRTRLINAAKEERKTKKGKSSLTSWKLDFQTAARQQIMIDVRNMTVSVSNSVGANQIYDGHHMALTFRSWGQQISEIFDPNVDVLMYDNHFTSEANKFVLDNADLGYSTKNIVNPIIKNQNGLTAEELELKESISAMRSLIESEKFGKLVSKFKFFSRFTKCRTDSFVKFNVQLHVALVLLDITTYIERNEDIIHQIIEIDKNDWMEANFDFPCAPEEPPTSKLVEEFLLKSKESHTSQDSFLSSLRSSGSLSFKIGDQSSQPGPLFPTSSIIISASNSNVDEDDEDDELEQVIDILSSNNSSSINEIITVTGTKRAIDKVNTDTHNRSSSYGMRPRKTRK